MSHVVTESSTPTASRFPGPVLEALAMRVRPHGLCLVLRAVDGRIIYMDPSAPACLRERVPASLAILPEQTVGAADADPVTVVPSPEAGTLVASFPWMDRRTPLGTLAIIARAGDAPNPQAANADAEWRCLPLYSSDDLGRHAQTLRSMARDQLRLTQMEGELSNLSAQLSNTYEELSVIYQLSSGMQINRGPSEFFRLACLELQQVLGVRAMGVVTRAAIDRPYEPAIFGDLELPPSAVGRFAAQLLGDLGRKRAPILLNDLAADASYGWLAPAATRMLAVPLQHESTMLGCLFAFDKAGGRFDSVDSKLLTSIASESAIYLQNALLFDDVHGLMMGLLHSLTSAVDAKDAYTCGHSERVALLSRLLAQKAGLPAAEVERIYIAGLLHDVGKIGVPEAVLQKTGRLTAEEFSQMKRHPEIGARILRDVRQVGDIIPGVLHHHERFDGKGYPHGLSGESIPRMGRIICLADCFDAMTSNRTYRRALPLEVALTEIRRCSGTQFDPGLAEVFLRIGIDAFRDVLSNHNETSRRLLMSAEAARAA